VLVDSVIALPVAFAAMPQYLAGCGDRVALSLWLFADSAAPAAGIAVATIP